jgi:seryl-tRNA synthetase
MLDLKTIRENPKAIEGRLRRREPSLSLGNFPALDAERRRIIQEVEALKQQRNEASGQIAALKRAGQADQAERLIAQMGSIAEHIKADDAKLAEIERTINDLLSRLPNIPHESVPVSYDKRDKVVVREHQQKLQLDFPFLSHVELGKRLDILDFERAALMAGARFPLYKGLGARLEMALIQFMFQYQVVENGYTPILPPHLGNRESFYTSSQLPKFEEDDYRIERDDLYLNPTAEVMLCNMHRGEILSAEQLPLNYAAYTACFRREAGAAGEEERGLIRMHQFNKVELFKFTKPEESYAQLEQLVRDAEDILQTLGLHYRVVLLPTGDLSFQSSKTYDLEVWLPSQERYYEVSSCSNCEAFQARRGEIRYRPEKGAKPAFVHTLNGSGLATSRLFAAILESNQCPDGSVVVPQVLRAGVGADVISS